MGRKMLKKLRSRKGASLTFALLAFLVCAVISAVLLASASASAGRLSGLVKSDQRYYAVNSAAQLFCDALKDQQFTIERTEKTPYTLTTTVTHTGGHENKNTPVREDGTKTYSIDMAFNAGALPSSCTGTVSDVIEKSIMTEAALYYVFGDSIYSSTSMPGLVKDAFANSVGNQKTWTFELKQYSATPAGAGEETPADLLAVDAQFTMDTSGNIVIRFQNQAAPVYKIEVTLSATVSNSDNSTNPGKTSITTYGETVPLEDGYQYDIVENTTETIEKSTTISWMVTDVKKVTT